MSEEDIYLRRAIAACFAHLKKEVVAGVSLQVIGYQASRILENFLAVGYKKRVRGIAFPLCVSVGQVPLNMPLQYVGPDYVVPASGTVVARVGVYIDDLLIVDGFTVMLPSHTPENENKEYVAETIRDLRQIVEDGVPDHGDIDASEVMIALERRKPNLTIQVLNVSHAVVMGTHIFSITACRKDDHAIPLPGQIYHISTKKVPLPLKSSRTLLSENFKIYGNKFFTLEGNAKTRLGLKDCVKEGLFVPEICVQVKCGSMVNYTVSYPGRGTAGNIDDTAPPKLVKQKRK
jgi:hypothetical protein